MVQILLENLKFPLPECDRHTLKNLIVHINNRMIYMNAQATSHFRPAANREDNQSSERKPPKEAIIHRPNETK